MPSIRDKEEIQSPALKEEQSVRAEGQETHNYEPASIQNQGTWMGKTLLVSQGKSHKPT